MPEARFAYSAADLLGARTPPKNAKDKLLDVAIDLFYRQGFHAVGLDLILTDAGVTKTTFYNHFESKEDLILAAVDRRDSWEHAAWQRAVRKVAGSDEPRAMLLAMFDVLDVWFNDPSFGGCIFLNAAAEFADPRDPIHQLAAKHKRRNRDEIRDLARAGGATDPETFADLYATLVEGTLILRHVHGRDDAARVAKPMVAQLVEQFLPRSTAVSPVSQP